MDDVIKEVKQLWPDARMVKGTPRHSQSNGGVERVNQTVQKKLGSWMKDNNSTHWSVGCKFVQWRYNTQFHEAIKNVPFVLVYGQKPRVGISNLPISTDILDTLATEAELNKIIHIQQEPVISSPASQYENDNNSSAHELPANANVNENDNDEVSLFC